MPDEPAEPLDRERPPPHDAAAECALLGAMMLSPDAIDAALARLPADGTAFYSTLHGTIFTTIVAMYGDGLNADAITVSGSLDRAGNLGRVGGPQYLHALISGVPTVTNAGSYADRVADLAVRRSVADVCLRNYQAAMSGRGTGLNILTALENDVAAAHPSGVTDDYKVLADLTEPTLEEIEAIANGTAGTHGVPTGLRDLDELTNGLHGGQMVIIAARPAVGKSTLALDFARAASIKTRLTSVFFSLEMGAPEVVMRLLSAEAAVPLHHMRTGAMTDADWDRLSAAMKRVQGAPMYLDDGAEQITMASIRAKCRRLKQRHDLRLVIVDYLQLMSSGGRPESRQQEVSEFSRSMKLLAKELDVPVVALSQLNRGPEQRTDKKPLMSDLRESGCLTGDTTLLRADTGAPVTFDALLRDGWAGVNVWAVEDGKMVARPLTNVFRSGVKRVHRMRLTSGRAVNATASHKFLTWRGWVPLGDLRPGDRVAVPRSLPAAQVGPLGWTEDRLALLAYLIADGTVLPRHATQIVDDDPDVLATAVRAAATEFGIEARVDPGVASRCPVVYLPSPQALTHGRRNPIHQWFHDLGIYGLRSHEKRLPDCLYRASDAEIGTFLRHLIATDGHIGAATRTVRFDTSSPALASGIQALLTRLGIPARIRRVPQAGGRDQYPVDVSGVGPIRRFADLVGAHGRSAGYLADLLARTADVRGNTNVDTLPREAWDDVRAQRIALGISERKFQASIGTAYCGSTLYKANMGRERALRVADALGYPRLTAAATNDLFWDVVAAIDPGDVVPVYDATVEVAHNFVANGIIVHNSLEQDADMVMLLHREDLYEKESPRAGEADIIVAKHRNGPTATVTTAFQGHYSRFVDLAY